MFKKHLRRSRKRLVRYSLLSANLALLVVVILFVSGEPTPGESAKRSAAVGAQEDTVALNPLDQLSSADIAVQVAQLSGLDQDEIVATRNEADSNKFHLSVAPTEMAIAAKPQIVNTNLKSHKDIKIYVAQAGETVPAIARKFDITSESLRWSNSLTGDAVDPGVQLYIPPVEGIVYTVQEGDTPERLAAQYQSNKESLIRMNDAEIGGLKVGKRIIIPGGRVQPRPTRARAIYFGFAFGNSPAYGRYNGYGYGYCTWYVANKRRIPNNWGNADTWDEGARATPGFTVDRNPSAGAILQDEGGFYGNYHVAYVEQVLRDSSGGLVGVRVSEMNVAGWNTVSSQVISAAELRRHGIDFIH